MFKSSSPKSASSTSLNKKASSNRALHWEEMKLKGSLGLCSSCDEHKGLSSSKTLKVEVGINGQRLVAMVDSGASYNFINGEKANRLSLRMEQTKAFRVRLANGRSVPCTGVYKAVAMELGGVVFQADFYGFALSHFDAVLGVSWLETLGPMLCDWRAQSLQFQWAGKEVKIFGISRNPIQRATPLKIEDVVAISVQDEGGAPDLQNRKRRRRVDDTWED